MKGFYILLLVFLLSCSRDPELPAGDRADGIKLADSVENDKALAIFQSQKIPFEIDRFGFINYMLKDQAKVLGIIREVRYGQKLNPKHYESIVIHTDQEKERYIAEFKQNNIPYNVEYSQGLVHLYWSQVYGPEVDQIQQKVNMELRAASRNKAVDEGRIPSFLLEK